LSRAPGLRVAVALRSFVRRGMICSFAAILFRGWPFDVRIEFVDLLPPIYQYERFRNRALFRLSEGPDSLTKRPNFKIIYNFLIKDKG